MVDIRYLETFYEVAICENVYAAAASLHMSQPTVSARIAKLQQNLGVKLFHKNGRNLELTPMGRRVLPYAEAYLSIQHDVLELIHSKKVLTVGISDFYACNVNYAKLEEFLGHSFGEMKMNYCVSDTNSLLTKFNNGSLDLVTLISETDQLTDAFETETYECEFTVLINQGRAGSSIAVVTFEDLHNLLPQSKLVIYPEIEHLIENCLERCKSMTSAVLSCPSILAAASVVVYCDNSISLFPKSMAKQIKRKRKYISLLDPRMSKYYKLTVKM